MRVFGSFDIVFCREPAVFEGGRANSLHGSLTMVSSSLFSPSAPSEMKSGETDTRDGTAPTLSRRRRCFPGCAGVDAGGGVHALHRPGLLLPIYRLGTPPPRETYFRATSFYSRAGPDPAGEFRCCGKSVHHKPEPEPDHLPLGWQQRRGKKQSRAEKGRASNKWGSGINGKEGTEEDAGR